MSTSTAMPASLSTRAPRARISFLDAARALAIIGMFLAHIAAFVDLPAPIEFLASGRSAIMFAVLAGISTVLIARSGALTEHERLGFTNSHSSRNLLTRALILFLIGITLPLISVGPIIILATYAVLYLFAIPLLRLSTRWLFALTVVTSIVTPLLSFGLRTLWPDTSEELVIGGVPTILSFTSLEAAEQALRQLLLDGMYPVLTWLPFLLAGIVIGRLTLDHKFTARLSGTAGAVLAVVGYGTSGVLVSVTDIMSDRLAPFREMDPAFADASNKELQELFGTIAYADLGVTNINDGRSLLFASNHSGSITEIVGGIGFVLLLLAALSLIERYAAPLLAPFNALGRMPLTYYVAHVIGFFVIALTGKVDLSLWLFLFGFIAMPMLCASLWFRFFRRGPLETLMHSAAQRASGFPSPQPKLRAPERH